MGHVAHYMTYLAAQKVSQSSCTINEKTITHLGPHLRRPDPPAIRRSSTWFTWSYAFVLGDEPGELASRPEGGGKKAILSPFGATMLDPGVSDATLVLTDSQRTAYMCLTEGVGIATSQGCRVPSGGP